MGIWIQCGGRNSSVGSAWARCPQRRRFPLGIFSVEGIFPLELTWVQIPFPPKLRVKRWWMLVKKCPRRTHTHAPRTPHTHTHMRTRTTTHLHSLTHTHTHTHTHSHTHTHTYTYSHIYSYTHTLTHLAHTIPKDCYVTLSNMILCSKFHQTQWPPPPFPFTLPFQFQTKRNTVFARQ